MKIVSFFITSLITIFLIVLFNTKLILPAPLGRLLSPQHGVWQNAEPVDADFNAALNFSGLKGNTRVYLDNRLVPHIFAERDDDALFVQGYLHAKFRLWQMEFQTHAAAGRLSEVLGDSINGKDVLNGADRLFRRLGLGYAAEQALKEAEKDPETKLQMDAYTAGVNAYIKTLRSVQIPLEYKLLGYTPELWTNLKSCLLLKYMAFDLAARENDFEATNARTIFSMEDFNALFPMAQDTLDPIIPRGTIYSKPGIIIKSPSSVDSLYLNNSRGTNIIAGKPDRDNGSNNWAVNGKKTASGAPILCNDPHLGLNLPSLWFEMQIRTATQNAYGISLPGVPYIIIGFNDSCAFGVTNAGRDVKDYYQIKFKDKSRKQYWYNGQWVNTGFRYERISIKNKRDFIDTVAYTFFGPVMYDKKYNGSRVADGNDYAVRWKAHDPGNEFKTFNRLNKTKNYKDYYAAIQSYYTPGQNFAYASKRGTIAMWAQGQFPAKWKRQGDFVMPGTDSNYMWQGNIPQEENPHMVNPERNFVSSANQFPADSSYPYYLGTSFTPYRGLIINRLLTRMNNISVRDMMAMQTNNYNIFAELARPLFLRYIAEELLNTDEKKYLNRLKEWNLRSDGKEIGPTVFELAWNNLENSVWNDDFKQTTLKTVFPDESTLLEGLLRDSLYKFADDISTPQKESLRDVFTASFKKAVVELKKTEREGKLEWAKYKDTRINHLLSIPAFGRMHLPVGGGTHIINATKTANGPSWRMIVHLSARTEAYGVYPGGQSGNPGSRFYDNFVDTWAAGKYYPLFIMEEMDIKDEKVKWKMNFSKEKKALLN